ncbi:MAG TPA: ATP-dependent Clp protease adapter ClpS [Actinomycetota bacterium]|jgi:ATP-dependent Clp protease adaptor protein ClpS
MSDTAVAPVEVERPDVEDDLDADVPWIVIVWNDPINLMSYVTYVFQKLFGFSHDRAQKLMWDVHTKGKAVVANGSQSECEGHVARLHAHGLWATLQKDR